MTRKLFGTDGVRGVAGELLTAELALALGRAATRNTGVQRPQVLIVRDTRESGEMLQAALAAGVSAAGGDALLGGVLPTPAAPLLVGRYGFDLAVVLSASHNPYRDNGIKFFAGDGYKLSDESELAIERELETPDGAAGDAPAIGRIRELRGAPEDYLRELHTRFRELALHGARRAAGLRQRRHLPGRARDLQTPRCARVTVIADTPDGRNINDGCGSTHVEELARAVLAGGHALGFAFDGDGDRVLAVDRRGVVVDGDELLALATLHLRDAGRLDGDGVAVTVMTNYGFHAAMERAGVARRHHPGRRPLRARGAACARLDARRRAVRPHHRHGLQPHRRRHRQRAADARGARRQRISASATRCRSSRSVWSTSASATAARSRKRMSSTRPCGPPSWSSGDAGACSCARAAPSRWCG